MWLMGVCERALLGCYLRASLNQEPLAVEKPTSLSRLLDRHPFGDHRRYNSATDTNSRLSRAEEQHALLCQVAPGYAHRRHQ